MRLYHTGASLLLTSLTALMCPHFNFKWKLSDCDIDSLLYEHVLLSKEVFLFYCISIVCLFYFKITIISVSPWASLKGSNVTVYYNLSISDSKIKEKWICVCFCCQTNIIKVLFCSSLITLFLIDQETVDWKLFFKCYWIVNVLLFLDFHCMMFGSRVKLSSYVSSGFKNIITLITLCDFLLERKPLQAVSNNNGLEVQYFQKRMTQHRRLLSHMETGTNCVKFAHLKENQQPSQWTVAVLWRGISASVSHRRFTSMNPVYSISIVPISAVLIFVLTKLVSRRCCSHVVDGCGYAVLITGCDSGFGHQLAQCCDRRGFVVFAGCLSPEGAGAQSLAQQSSSNLKILKLDVTSDEDVQQAKKTVQENMPEKGECGTV